MLKIYNTLTKKKESFVPIDENNVRYYSCGPTVYNNIHIGNARAFVCADLLAKVLKGIYKKVTFVSNITDIDDKIIEASVKEKISIKELSKRYFEQYKKDTKFLGIDDPDNQPFATDFIKEMIDFINVLIDKDAAYVANGNVLFRVKSFKNYGILSERIIQEQDSGSRIDVETYKEDPNDFTLWKPSTDDEPGWDSPWGLGRPGWHLECSVMSEIVLGVPFDIHGGGNDLKFPHHDNEIAQTCAYHSNESAESFAKYWFHNGFLNLDNEKMSKSLGNVVYIDDLKKNFKGNEIRLALLSTHYRQPIPWSLELLEQSKNIYQKLNREFKKYNLKELKFYKDSKVGKALLDDLNTPLAIREMQRLVSSNDSDLEENISTFKYIFEGSDQDLSIDKKLFNEIEKLIEERNNARNNNDYEKADKIRDKLSEMNVKINDINGKTEWEIL
ncbi:cysteine--tRNA ligase [bacterium]|nr:cysteine--tRNA ligase [bacterium]